MKEILEKYCRYLLMMGKAQLRDEMKFMQIKKPAKWERQKCINLLLQKELPLIELRVLEIEKIDLSDSTVKEQNAVQVGEAAKKKKPQIKRSNEETKIEEIRNHIYGVFAQKFEKMVQGIDVSQQKQSEKNKKLILDDLLLFKTPAINSLLNCQQEIQLHPSKIQYEYQRNIEELLFSFFPQRTLQEIETKVKIESKYMLPSSFVFEGNTIEKLLMLYGVRKEEDFLKDYRDPLQALLLEQKKDQKKVSNLVFLFEKLPLRPNYYQAVISSLTLEQLYGFIEKISFVKNIPSFSDFSKISSSLLFVRMVRNNKRLFPNSYYAKLLGLSNSGQDSKSMEAKIFIERWILQTLKLFCEMVQNHKYSKLEEVSLVEKILIYKQIKKQIQESLSEIDREKGELLQLLSQLVNQHAKDSVFQPQLLDKSESYIFIERLKEIVLFLDPNTSLASQVKQKLMLYENLLHYFFVMQKIELSKDIIHKIITDLEILIKKDIVSNEKSMELLGRIERTIFEHFGPLQMEREYSQKMASLMRSLKFDVQNECKI